MASRADEDAAVLQTFVSSTVATVSLLANGVRTRISRAPTPATSAMPSPPPTPPLPYQLNPLNPDNTSDRHTQAYTTDTARKSGFFSTTQATDPLQVEALNLPSASNSPLRRTLRRALALEPFTPPQALQPTSPPKHTGPPNHASNASRGLAIEAPPDSSTLSRALQPYANDHPNTASYPASPSENWRTLYIDGLRRLLLGLPPDLSDAELAFIHDALPSRIRAARGPHVHHPRSRRWRGAPSSSSDGPTWDDAPSLLRRALAATIELFFVLGAQALPIVGLGWTWMCSLARRHRVKERAGREAMRWAAGVAGGVVDGVGRGCRAVENVRGEAQVG